MEKKYHFVYKTVCLTTRHYYLGVHSTDNLCDGYVGSGIKFLNYVKKYGRENFIKEIIAMCSTRVEAFEQERSIITEAVLADEMCLNLIDGGIGYRHTYDETSQNRISKTRRERIAAGLIIPPKHTEEHKQKMRNNNPGGRATSKQIYQIDPNSGKIIKVWDSLRQAGISLNIKSWRNISHCAKNAKYQTVNGFFWRWVGDADVVDGQLTNIQELNAIRLNPSTRAGKQIQQSDQHGEAIRTWDSSTQAGDHFGVTSGIITKAAISNNLWRGFYWKRIQ
jgi:hypothetical protein